LAVSRRIDEHLEDVDTTVLSNEVADVDDGAPEALHHLAETVASARHAAECTERPNQASPVFNLIDTAYTQARRALDMYVEELVATACADVIQQADEWADRDTDMYSAAEYKVAKQDARWWLQHHLDAARRAGVLEGTPNGVRAGSS
jgi:hypothetical protein